MYRTVTEQNNQSLLEKGKVEVRQVHVTLGGQPGSLCVGVGGGGGGGVGRQRHFHVHYHMCSIKTTSI